MKAVMEGAKWVRFIEVGGRLHADLVESYIKAHGIETELIQEAYFQYRVGAALGPVEILVLNYQLDEAQKLYAKSGWDFDITETDDAEDAEDDE
jgi:hypothetical protein